MIDLLKYAKIESSWIDSKEFKLKRLKYLVDFLRGIEPGSANYNKEETGRRFIRVTDIGGANRDKIYVDIESEINVEKEDILLCLDGSPGLVVRGFEGIFSTGLRKLKLNNEKLDYNFLFYSLNCDFVQECIKFFSKGTTIMHASTVVNYLKQPLPSLNKQEKIAQFLDNKTSKINKIIQNKNNQKELLIEYKNIIINEAVTKGLDENIRLKDSKVEWVGKIPENWDFRRMKYVTDLRFSNVDKKVRAGEIDVVSCNYTDVYNNNYISPNMNFLKITAKQETIDKFSICEGDVLITKDSETPEDIAVPAYVKGSFENVLCGYHLAMIRPTNRVLGTFLFRLFQSSQFNSHFENSANGITRYGLGMKSFKDVFIPLPSLEEQQKIADYLDQKTSKIRKSIEIIEKEVQKLEEFKKILINNAVTGKIKVY